MTGGIIRLGMEKKRVGAGGAEDEEDGAATASLALGIKSEGIKQGCRDYTATETTSRQQKTTVQPKKKWEAAAGAWGGGAEARRGNGGDGRGWERQWCGFFEGQSSREREGVTEKGGGAAVLAEIEWD
ncbi:hypothetical protein Droror1_Dr00024892 [Drosera rotundifolia]